MKQAAQSLIKRIEDEKKKFKNKQDQRIIIAGHGQGCETVITAYYYYTGQENLGGVICLSGMNPM